MKRIELIANRFYTKKSYDEILCDSEFNEELRDVLKQCLKKYFPYSIELSDMTPFFRMAYTHCGGMVLMGYCCNLTEYDGFFLRRDAQLWGNKVLVVAAMVYSIFSVQETRVDGTSSFLDKLEEVLAKEVFFHLFKELVVKMRKRKKRYVFNFAIYASESPGQWDLEDFEDALRISTCGNFIEKEFCWFLDIPWEHPIDRSVALGRIKELFNRKYKDKIIEIEKDEKVSLNTSFDILYETANEKIKMELLILYSKEKKKTNNKCDVVKYPKKQSAFLGNITKPEIAECVLKRLHELIDRQEKPIEKIKPLCAAICAGAVKETSHTEFESEFGKYKKQTYSVNRKKYKEEKWRTEAEDFYLLVSEFKEMIK